MDKLQENVTDTGCEKDECEKEKSRREPLCSLSLLCETSSTMHVSYGWTATFSG